MRALERMGSRAEKSRLAYRTRKSGAYTNDTAFAAGEKAADIFTKELGL